MRNPFARFSSKVGNWLGLGLAALFSGFLVAVMLTPLISVGGVVIKNTVGVFDALPDFIDIGRQAQINEIYAQKGPDPDKGYVKIADVYWQDREELPLEGMSQFLIDAAVDGEDRRFYDHKGVDLTGIIRAALGNIVSGGIQSGASTLTMQVIKNIYVQRAEALPTEEERQAAYAEATSQSPARKLKEIKLAVGLEKRYTKDEILAAYLNISGFGGTTYGVESAAQRYFGVSAKDVTLAQAASLIAIVQYPMERNLSMPENFAANQARRDVILGAMRSAGDITQEQYDEAVAIPVDENFVKLTPPKNGCIAASKYATFFCDYVVKNVVNFAALGNTVDERINNWHIGGYKLYTTLNMKLQKVAQTEVWKVPNDTETLELGSVANSVEVGTGRVLTMAENKIFNDTLEGGGPNSTAVNFSTDRDYGGSSGFQTGSTYKIMALLAWLQAGRGLGETVDASEFKKEQSTYLDTCTDGGGPWGGIWEFQNDSPAPKQVTVLQAVSASINSAFATIGQQVDQCAIRHIAESLGVHRADGATLQTNPSAILGTNELAPLTLVSAWAAIANEGKYCPPIVLDHAVGPTGEELVGQAVVCTQGIDPDLANAAIFAMKGVMNGGTGAASNPGDGVPIFGKTGTADGSVQTWIVTSTSRVASVAWAGNIVGKYPLRSFPGGAYFRHTIMSTLMRAANAMYTGMTDWPAPPGNMLTGSGAEVPSVLGLTFNEAKDLLESLGYKVEDGGTVDSSEYEEGQVAETDPAEGTSVGPGSTITLYMSSGTYDEGSYFEMPNYANTDYLVEDAESDLSSLGAESISSKCQVASDPADPQIGYVISQKPSAGKSVSIYDSFQLTYLAETCD